MVKQKEMKLFLRKNDVSIIAIYERRVKEEKSRNIINKLMPGWDRFTMYMDREGVESD